MRAPVPRLRQCEWLSADGARRPPPDVHDPECRETERVHETLDSDRPLDTRDSSHHTRVSCVELCLSGTAQSSRVSRVGISRKCTGTPAPAAPPARLRLYRHPHRADRRGLVPRDARERYTGPIADIHVCCCWREGIVWVSACSMILLSCKGSVIISMFSKVRKDAECHLESACLNFMA